MNLGIAEELGVTCHTTLLICTTVVNLFTRLHPSPRFLSSNNFLQLRTYGSSTPHDRTTAVSYGDTKGNLSIHRGEKENLLGSGLQETHVPRRMNDDSKVTGGARRDVKSMDHIPAELVRQVLEYLLGEELVFALTSKSNLTHTRSLRKDGMLPMQRRSAYLHSAELTTYMLAHDMT